MSAKNKGLREPATSDSGLKLLGSITAFFAFVCLLCFGSNSRTQYDTPSLFNRRFTKSSIVIPQI